MIDRPSRRDVRRSFYVRLAAWGFVLIAVSSLIAFATGNVSSVLSFIPPAVAAIVMAAFLRATGRGLIAGLVVALLIFLFSLLLGLLHIVHLDSFPDFVPSFLRIVGSAAAAGALIAAVRQYRRRTTGMTSPRVRFGVAIGAAVVLVLSAASGALTYTGEAESPAPPGTTPVRTEDDLFNPAEVRAEPGRTQVFVRNTDSYAHTFTIEKLGVDEYVGPRAYRLVTFEIPKNPAARYAISCLVTGHEDMVGTLVPTR